MGQGLSAVHIAKYIVTLALVAFLVWLGWANYESIAAVDWTDPAVLSTVLIALCGWIGAQTVMGVGWWMLVDRVIPLRTAVAIMLTTQIGKYLPGNVGQWVGRAYLGHRHGVELSRGLASMLIETLLVVGCSLLLALVALRLDPAGTAPLVDVLPAMPVIVTIMGLTLLAIVALLLLPERVRRILSPTSPLQKVVPPSVPLRTLAMVAGIVCTIYVIHGTVLWLAVPVLSGVVVPFSVCLAIFAVAFVAGFLTPGAPGGLGVREAAIVLGLSGYVPTGDAAAIAFALRGASVLGDLVIFLIGLLWMPPMAPSGTGRSSNSV